MDLYPESLPLVHVSCLFWKLLCYQSNEKYFVTNAYHLFILETKIWSFLLMINILIDNNYFKATQIMVLFCFVFCSVNHIEIVSPEYTILAVFTQFVPRVPEKPEMDNVSFDLVNWMQDWKPSNRIGVKIDCLFRCSLHMLISSSEKILSKEVLHMLLLIIVIISNATITSTFPFFFFS